MATIRGEALPNSLKPAQLKSLCLEAIQRFPHDALTTREILRLTDHLYLQEEGHSPELYMNSQSVRLAVGELVAEGLVYRRKADPTLDGAPMFYGQRHTEIWLTSCTRPVPPWTTHVTEALEEMKIPQPRNNPLSKNNQRAGATRRSRVPKDSSAKVEVIVSLIREFARDTEDGNRVRQLESDLERLQARFDVMQQERNDAVKSLKAIARAQETMRTLLAGGNLV